MRSILNCAAAFLLFVLLIALPGCGGSTGTVAPNPIVITLNSANPALGPGDTFQFTATVTGTANTAVTWSVQGSSANGTIDANGLYTAPANIGTYRVIARSAADPGVSVTANITVGTSIALTWPLDVKRAIPGSTIKFRASVAGAGQVGNVTWSVIAGPNDGTISQNGLFTAGSTEGLVTVKGALISDPSKFVTQQVKVVGSTRIKVEVAGQGNFILKLRPDKAPNHVRNIVNLTNDGFYDGIVWHRYDPGFVIQCGDPLTKTLPLTDPSIGTGGPGYTINFETNDLLNKKNSLAMARGNDINSAGSQWYINLKDNPALDGQYCVFGQVDTATWVIPTIRRGDVITKMTCIP